MPHTARRLMWIVLMMGFAMLEKTATGQTTQPAQPPPPTTESRYSRTPEQEINFQQALLHYSRGQLPQAESEFGDVVKSDPGDAEAFYYLGLSQLDQNKALAAVANFDR
jgi:TolA-binding protein